MKYISPADLLRAPGQYHVPLILSGMGPECGADFIKSAIRQRPSARRDQDHMGYDLKESTGMPDRTEALLAYKAGDSWQYNDIRERLIQFARFGRRDGLRFMVTLCNTVHAWRQDPQVQQALATEGLPWLSIMDAVAADLHKEHPQGTRIAVLATTGTIMMRLYHDALEKEKFDVVSPAIDSGLQKNVMAAIYDKSFGIKARGATPEATKRLIHAVEWAQAQGALAVISGCTEIPLALNEDTYHGGLQLINPMDSVARETIRYAFDPQAQFPE